MLASLWLDSTMSLELKWEKSCLNLMYVTQF